MEFQKSNDLFESQHKSYIKLNKLHQIFLAINKPDLSFFLEYSLSWK